MKLYAACVLRRHGPDPFIVQAFRTAEAAKSYCEELAKSDPARELYCFIAVKKLEV